MIHLAATLALLLTLTSCRVPPPKAVVERVPADYNSEFLYWCTGPDKWQVYGEAPTSCLTPVSRGTWDHTPITVNSDEALVQETREAVDAFNKQVGFQLFEYDYTNYEPDIVVGIGGRDTYAAARAALLTQDGRMHGLILFYNGLEDNNRSDIMFHELGHTVGLKHDHDNYMSIMYPSANSRVAWLEAQDVDALRQIYNQ